MNYTPLFLSLLLLLPFPAHSETHEFTDTEGRKLKAEILEYGDGWINVKRTDGRKATLTFNKLSDADKTWFNEWLAAKEKDAAAKKRAIEVPAKIVSYCKEQKGKQVGNGECWTLANECFKSCGLKRPGGQLRVWGRKLETKEKPQPGDIVEFKAAKFSDGGMTGPEHTAVVVGLGKQKGIIQIAEQNWGGNKTVRIRDFDPAGLKSGEMMFYRPE
ncbi:MAG TPA: CHAP domain-containing protein [Verrucomicrobiales bacterium]|nr:CHAP domain-containing protein [Verrucomicrobiales bacterium]